MFLGFFIASRPFLGREAGFAKAAVSRRRASGVGSSRFETGLAGWVGRIRLRLRPLLENVYDHPGGQRIGAS